MVYEKAMLLIFFIPLSAINHGFATETNLNQLQGLTVYRSESEKTGDLLEEMFIIALFFMALAALYEKWKKKPYKQGQ